MKDSTMQTFFSINLKELLKKNNLAQKDFAAGIGATAEHVNAVLSGRVNLSTNFIKKTAKYFKINEMDLFTLTYDASDASELLKTFEDDEYEQSAPHLKESVIVKIPYEDAELSMGGGAYVTRTLIKNYLGFRLDWLQSKGKPNSMAVFRASGDSMEPTIPDPSIVLIDKTQKTPIDGKIYFIVYGDAIFLKRLKLDKNTGRVSHYISDGLNGYEHEIREGEHFEIIGRALWFASEL
ncbi:MAG: helix-turn-helix transcriptional regulator [Desulfovibrionaceae bacterium]|nr:helix-turn-helix transcriptional regulator [Desulfovibrionaceae bacterium]MBF0514555.1 helix-turn-helix transcriptional regulator [Desulfovibrionaceae bacterium]